MNAMSFTPAKGKELTNFVAKHHLVEIFCKSKELAACLQLMTAAPFKDPDLIVAPMSGSMIVGTNYQSDLGMIFSLMEFLTHDWSWGEVEITEEEN